MGKQAFKKGDRVEYTWPNRIIRKPPFTDQGTVIRAHRGGCVTIQWDHANRGKPQWWQSVDLLTKLPVQMTEADRGRVKEINHTAKKNIYRFLSELEWIEDHPAWSDEWKAFKKSLVLGYIRDAVGRYLKRRNLMEIQPHWVYGALLGQLFYTLRDLKIIVDDSSNKDCVTVPGISIVGEALE